MLSETGCREQRGERNDCELRGGEGKGGENTDGTEEACQTMSKSDYLKLLLDYQHKGLVFFFPGLSCFKLLDHYPHSTHLPIGGLVFFFPGLAASADSSRTAAANSALSSVALGDFLARFGGGATTSLSGSAAAAAFCLLPFFRTTPTASPAARTDDSLICGNAC